MTGVGIGWKRRVRRRLSRALRPLEVELRKRLLLGVDRLVLLSSRARPDPERVLLVRLDNIGDFVLWLHAAETLASFYKAQGKHVSLLANAVWKDWAAEFGLFDAVIGLEGNRFRRDLRYRVQSARSLRKLGFGTVVQASYTRVLGLGESIVRLSGATQRLGAEGTFERESAADRRISTPWYTQLFPAERAVTEEIQRNAALVRALTGSAYTARVADLTAHLELTVPESLVGQLGGSPYFVVFPGATFAGRLWPAEKYVAIAERLQQATGWRGVICGGPSERRQATEICANASVPLLNWVGETSLTGLAAVLAGAQVLIGNETSAIHMAAAVGTATICVLGGGHFGRFVPYRLEGTDGRPLPVAVFHGMGCFHCDWRCIFHPRKGTPVPCVDQVNVEQVWTALQPMVARSLADRGLHSGQVDQGTGQERKEIREQNSDELVSIR